jgi:hypothetical protein
METVGGAESNSRQLTTRWVASHAAGLGLLLVLGLWLGISLWGAPVPAGGSRLKAAADGDQITNINRLASPPSPLSHQPLFLFGHRDPTDNTGTVLVWTTQNGQRYYTDATTVPGPFPNNDGVTTGSLISGDGSNPTSVDRVSAYLLQRTHFEGGVAWAALAQLALVVGAIGAIRSRPPVRGTRWFWFWVINLPLGVGVLWFALRERFRGPTPVRERWNGGQGFAISVVGVPLIQLAGFLGQLLFTRI